MSRAIVLIGVSTIGGGDFAVLPAVESAVQKMEDWAKTQGIAAEQIVRLTDSSGPVTVSQIYAAIDSLLKDESLEQLIVYFAGHGFVNSYQEYWLLSGAPRASAEAVNLTGTMALAMSGVVPHVIFISDACRTGAQSVQMGRVSGSNVFPNINDANASRYIDVFYATRLGDPALQVSIGKTIHAVYSDTLAAVLGGSAPEIIDNGFIRPRPLKQKLAELVPIALNALHAPPNAIQSPDAHILSGDDAWVAKFAPSPADPLDREPSAPLSSRKQMDVVDFPQLLQMPESELAIAASDHGQMVSTAMSSIDAEQYRFAQLLLGHTEDSEVAGSVRRQRTEYPRASRRGELGDLQKIVTKSPDPLVRVDPSSSRWTVSEVTKPPLINRPLTQGREIEVLWNSHAAVQSLVEFEGGSGVLVPSFEQYAVSLLLNAQGLRDVSYGPIDSPEPRGLKTLRKAISKASEKGVFSLRGVLAEELARKMQSAKFKDPALATYAAYAYHDLGQIDRIREMQQYVRAEFGFGLYDLALLSRDFLREDGPGYMVVPSAPMMSQGWAFIDALAGAVPDQLRALRQHRRPSLWTHYTEIGMQLIKQWLVDSANLDFAIDPVFRTTT